MTNNENEKLANLLYPNALDTSFYINKYRPRNVAGEVTRIAPSPTGYLHVLFCMRLSYSPYDYI